MVTRFPLIRVLMALVMAVGIMPLAGCSDSGEFVPIATVSYASHQSRSPFRPPSGQEELELLERRSVEPDFTRPKEYLERFTLDSLTMVGTITKPGAPLEALLRDPTGAVNRVKTGNYMGKNFGRVVEVTDSSVSVIEIVPDGQDGWVERPRTIRVAE